METHSPKRMSRATLDVRIHSINLPEIANNTRKENTFMTLTKDSEEAKSNRSISKDYPSIHNSSLITEHDPYWPTSRVPQCSQHVLPHKPSMSKFARHLR